MVGNGRATETPETHGNSTETSFSWFTETSHGNPPYRFIRWGLLSVGALISGELGGGFPLA